MPIIKNRFWICGSYSSGAGQGLDTFSTAKGNEVSNSIKSERQTASVKWLYSMEWLSWTDSRAGLLVNTAVTPEIIIIRRIRCENIHKWRVCKKVDGYHSLLHISYLNIHMYNLKKHQHGTFHNRSLVDIKSGTEPPKYKSEALQYKTLLFMSMILVPNPPRQP